LYESGLELAIAMKLFEHTERERMLALKGVGATVISRLEQLGFSSLHQLEELDPRHLTKQISEMMGSTCWHNSPLANAAIRNITDLAKEKSASRKLSSS
jgi:nucleotidyltransferase/DNA polymerase involved in DNA repair